MILETFLAVNVGLSATNIATKFIHKKLRKEMKEKILNEGLYHFTTEENADAIIKSKYIKPSSMFTSYGKRRCYFFAGLPPYEVFVDNLSDFNCEFTAVKIDLKRGNESDINAADEKLSKFKQRVLADDAIVYEGKCELEDECLKKVQLVLDLDENRQVYLREKTQEEIESGEYIPSEELRSKIHMDDKVFGKLINTYKAYEYNIKNKKLRSEIFNKITSILKKNKQVALPKGKEENREIAKENIRNSLKGMVNDAEQIENNEKQRCREQEHNKEDIYYDNNTINNR